MLEDYEEGKGRGKLGPAPQPGRGLERVQPSGQGPALKLKWTCIGVCVCVHMCEREKEIAPTHSLERRIEPYVSKWPGPSPEA